MRTGRRIRAVMVAFGVLVPQAAPVFAQTPPPAPTPAPAPAPSPPAPQQPPRLQPPEARAGNRFADNDYCRPVLMSAIPLSLTPPAEWRGRRVEVFATINRDGSVAGANVIASNGAPAAMQDAAAALVKQSYHWVPLNCGRSSSTQRVVVSLPRLDCTAAFWQAPLPLTLAQDRRSVSATVHTTVAEDGKTQPRISSSSGDAALDAALLAHVNANWRAFTLREGCGPDTRIQVVRFADADCVPRPVAESRTMPEAGAADRRRSLSLLIGVSGAGQVMFTTVAQGSGDAALDAAAAAHVKANWRWQPATCARAYDATRGAARPVMDFATISFR